MRIPLFLFLVAICLSCNKEPDCYDCYILYMDSSGAEVVVDRKEVCGMTREETHEYYRNKMDILATSPNLPNIPITATCDPN